MFFVLRRPISKTSTESPAEIIHTRDRGSFEINFCVRIQWNSSMIIIRGTQLIRTPTDVEMRTLF